MHLQMTFSLPFRPVALLMKRRMTAMYERLGSDLKRYAEPDNGWPVSRLSADSLSSAVREPDRP